uniref:FAD-binding domain-containing protein n=1 Tax=Kalanchoe fedtschenkoi TaxID=63787 RepID=A0A7N0ZZI4_KALFE
MEQQTDIVIVGGGICGVAVALALQRKGIKSLVLEKSESLRAIGTAIIVQPNGWHALEQLGVAAKLRQTAVLIQGGQHVFLGTGRRSEISFGEVDERGKLPEVRCVKRKDLIEALADQLLPDTISFGRHVVSMKVDYSSHSSCPLLELSDGTQVKAKIVIGCDGVNSTVADYVGVKATDVFSVCAVRGFTYYGEGHHFVNEFLVLSIPSTNIQVGRMPMTDNLVYWFITRDWSSQDPNIVNKPELIRQSSMQAAESFPKEIQDMVKDSEASSLHLTQLKYRPPWELMRRDLYKGTVALAGDALHAMGPFLAQGGSASLEDAVVLARNLSRVVEAGEEISQPRVERALGEYVKERKMRVVKLSTQTYLVGKLIEKASGLTKLVVILLLAIFFGNKANHAKFRCGEL